MFHAGACTQGTGTADEMALEERTAVSTEGCVIADVAIVRPPAPAGAPPGPRASTSGRVRVCSTYTTHIPSIMLHAWEVGTFS